MSTLFERIRAAVEQERYLVGVHALNRLEERGIEEWQVVAGVRNGRLLRENPHGDPNPTVQVEQILPDGSVIVAVWAWLTMNDVAKLVTVWDETR